MKKNQILATIAMVALLFGANAQIRVNSSGQVGINNTSPSYRLDVNGNLRVYDNYSGFVFNYGELKPDGYASLGSSGVYWDALYAYDAYFYYSTTYYSDRKLKTDIREVGTLGDKLLQLKPVRYKMQPLLRGVQKSDSISIEKSKADQLGFIAQDVEELFPELVTRDSEGTLGIKYIEFIPLLVKAYQEQQTEIAGLKARIEALENQK